MYVIDVLRKASRMPPSAAIAAESPNAYSFTPGTLMPSAAAARSFVRTAIIRLPTRPAADVADDERRDEQAAEREDAVARRDATRS